MLDHEIPTDGKPTNTSDPAELLALLSRPPVTTASDVLPIAPNLIATFVSFGFMVVVPWLVLWVIDWLIDRHLHSTTSIRGSSRSRWASPWSSRSGPRSCSW